MALLSVDECKEILGIADNTYDAKITAMIPYVERDICEYCNNFFGDTVIYVYDNGGVIFARGSTLTSSTLADKITDAEDRFTTSGFRAGMDISVQGGSNYDIYTLAAVSTDTLTLNSSGEIESQNPDASYNTVGPILISRVKWPRPVKPVAAKMVWYLVDKPKQGDVKSESIDDYSVTYAGDHAYPERVLAGLRPYRRAILI